MVYVGGEGFALSRGYTQLRNAWSCVPTRHVDWQLHFFVATQTDAANLN